MRRLLADIEAGRVDCVVFYKVDRLSRSRNGRTAGAAVRNRYGALLKALLHCACCRCYMVHTYSVKSGPGAKRYRYYVCLAAQKKGWDTCASKSVPAGEIERFVVEQIEAVGRDPAVLEGTLRQMRQQHAKNLADLKTGQKMAERELARHHAALKRLAARPDADQLAALHEQIRAAEKRLTAVREKLASNEQQLVEVYPGFLTQPGSLAPSRPPRTRYCCLDAF